jgi:membrane protein
VPDPSDSARLIAPAGLRERVLASYPAAVVRRFFELELLDRSFGLAAQVFVALLPLIIVVVAVAMGSDGEYLAVQIIDRFGLAGAAEESVLALFSAPGAKASISMLAVLMCFLSAFSLARRLSRVWASIFDLPSLLPSQLWRSLVWIGLQLALLIAASELREVRRESGPVIAGIAIVALLAAWFGADAGGLRLLVPSVPRRLLLPSAALSCIGRIGLTAWSAVYMPNTLARGAEQYGPIGVTFSIFTLILAAVLVLLVSPLMVAVWDHRRAAP